MFFVVVALGGLVLLAVFSMLAMARKQDDNQDRLEIELRRENPLAPNGNHEGSLDNISVYVNPDLERIGANKTRIIGR